MNYYFSAGPKNYPRVVKTKTLLILGIYLGLVTLLSVTYVVYPEIPQWVTTSSFFILFIAGIIVIPLVFEIFKPHRCKICNLIVDSHICNECAMGKRRHFLDSPNSFTCKLCKKIIPDYETFLIHFQTKNNEGIGPSVHEGYEAINHVPEESVTENDSPMFTNFDDSELYPCR